MRDRYYVRLGRVQRAFERAHREWYHGWRDRRQARDKSIREDYEESRSRWFLERHNIVMSQQANGVEKVGFASKGDMLLFVLRYS